MLFLLLLIITVLLLFYYLFFWIRMARFKIPQDTEKPVIPVSVIVCAKNESRNIILNLPYILRQDYPDFEVIVVDDNSSDDTYYQLIQMKQEYPNLKIVRLSENVNFFSGKKFPLSIGIKSASNNHLLMTDADCMPVSDKWIYQMAASFTDKKEIVLGYGKYSYEKGILNSFIRFETILTALQYFSYSLAGIPFMGVGRNLAYTKKLFFANNGFTKHYNIASGDDDLFINSAADSVNTAVCLHLESFTTSEPHTRWKDWFIQKRRHLTAGNHYKIKHRFFLGMYSLLTLLFWCCFIGDLIFSNNFYLSISLFTIKSIVFLFIFYKVQKILHEKKIIWFSVFFEVILIIILGIIYGFNLISKPGKWK